MDIRTEGVQAVLGGSAILKGVDIQVGQRELVGIIGPNGSGKSTLLKCIYRVLKPTGGAVLLDGRDLDQYSYRESARRIAVVAQHNYYNFEFSVQDVVMMGRAPHKRALDRDNADDFRLVAEALELDKQDSVYYPAVPCVRMVFCTHNEVFLRYENLQPALSYLEKHAFAFAGDILGRSIARVMGKDNTIIHYYDVWLPIKDREIL